MLALRAVLSGIRHRFRMRDRTGRERFERCHRPVADARRKKTSPHRLNATAGLSNRTGRVISYAVRMTREHVAIAILHQDAHFVAVDKPAGLAAHRSHLVGRDDDYLIDRARRVIDGPLHLAHRLDRGTSGVVLLARSREIAARLGADFADRRIDKTYLAIVRGWPDENGEIDHPLTGASMTGAPKPALTRWRRLAQVEVPIALGRYPQQRYSLLELRPETGRYRQLRRHLHHVHHPIIGDATHGRGEHNRLFKQYFGSHRLLLHAWRLRLRHPVDGKALHIEAPFDTTWLSLLERFDWSNRLPSPDDDAIATAVNDTAYNPAG